MFSEQAIQAQQASLHLVGWSRLIGMAGSAVLAIGCLVEVANPSMGPRGDIVNALAFRGFLAALALATPGLLFTQLGFHHSGASGLTWLSRAAMFIGGAGCLFIALPALVGIFTLQNYEVQLIGQLATMMVAPILFGIGALRAKRVVPWKRAWPLLTGLWPPLMFGLAVPAGFPAFAVPGIAGILWFIWASSLTLQTFAKSERS